jgi:hypothetical protein
MDLADFYTVRAPVLWATLPSVLSHSALCRIKRCPLRYQLERSEFPDIGRFPARPNSAAVEGAIAHECLEVLFKAFSIAGLPDLGGERARECVRKVGLSELIQKKFYEARDQFMRHPRGAGFRPRTSVHQLANRVIRLFRQQYLSMDRVAAQHDPVQSTIARPQPDLSDLAGWLSSCGALTELTLRHPQLPFEGVIDLVCCRDGETVIVDYKAGAPDPGHRLQVMRYSLLWWRSTGQVPGRIEIQYLTEKKSEQVTEAALLRTEQDLKGEIDAASDTLESPPAKASPGDHCGFCEVRQFCDHYWQDDTSMLRSRGGFVDVQLLVNGDPSEYGFHAATFSGTAVKVTSSSEVGKLQYQGILNGQRLRMIGVRFEPRDSEFHVNASAEVWRMNNSVNEEKCSK